VGIEILRSILGQEIDGISVDVKGDFRGRAVPDPIDERCQFIGAAKDLKSLCSRQV
jgi:hypothetical protein